MNPVLEARSGLGPGYDAAESKRAVAERYKRCLELVPHTLHRLRSHAPFKDAVLKLRAAAWKDWHLLQAISVIVLNHNPPNRPERREQAMERVKAADKEDLPFAMFTVDRLRFALRMSMLDTLRGFGLALKSPSVDIDAIERLLATRYRYWDDDVEHDDPFPT